MKARLYEHELQKKEEENQKELNSKTDIGWGHQIRSYVLQPYQLVKDLRNKTESSNPSSILDGNIDLFIEEGIKIKKMKKIIVNLILFVIFSLILSLIILSTIGIETNKFNKFISKKISKSKNINLELSTIKFKLDPKQLSLFLETEKPNINYRELQIPVQNIKAYVDFISLIKVNPEIKKITIVLEELDIKELNRLSKIVKPSNFKSLLNNKVKSGKLISEIEFF